ncbi:MAG: CoA transferase [Dehalococcoidia bacterium]|nr:CoA transferase [Dehalococcoidia bacterium]
MERPSLRLPLENIRILDLTAVWAGPYTTKMLADMGAEVIKVESVQRPSQQRWAMMPDNVAAGNNGGAYHNKVNRNKYDITIDLTDADGVRVFKELVKICDVVAESYTPRVMKQFGLEYPVLKEIKPDIIMLSISGYGQQGPYRDYAAYGFGIEAMMGLPSLTGYADRGPSRPGVNYGDPSAGLYGSAAVLSALFYRRRTGKGQHIDLSMQEALTHLIGEQIMDYRMNERVAGRMGNRHMAMSPQGVYRCQGEEKWVAIAVRDDKDWRRFCEVTGHPEWIEDARFADSLSRWNNQAELDWLVADWTSQYDHIEAMKILQGAGIPAGAALSGKEILFDPHLKERRFFEMVWHPETGVKPTPGVVTRLSKTPGSIRLYAGMLGEHNELILGDYLGLSPADIASLEEKKVIGKEPVGPPPRYPIPMELLLDLGIVAAYEPDFKSQLGIE